MAVTSFTALTAAVVASVAAASPIKARDPMDDFQNVMINGHNWYRGEHAATALTWDDDAASNAAAWVNNCVFEHQSNNRYGENLAAGDLSGWDQVINLWGGERVNYNFDQPGFYENTGHFTQMVWAATTGFGCAWKQCPGGVGTLVACEYTPPGNVMGDDNQYFRDNVKPQTTGQPSDQFSS